MVLFTVLNFVEEATKRLKELDIPRMKAHQGLCFEREKDAPSGWLARSRPADIEAISETTVIKANQQAIKGALE